jgi:hypothetical protein
MTCQPKNCKYAGITTWSQVNTHGVFQLVIYVCSGSVVLTLVREKGFPLSLSGICVNVLIYFGSSIRSQIKFRLCRLSALYSTCLTYEVLLVYELRDSSLFCRAFPLIHGTKPRIICFHLVRNSNAIADTLLGSPTDCSSVSFSFLLCK